MKTMRLHKRDKRGVCTEEEKDISIVKRREGRDIKVHIRTIEKRVYQTLKVTLNGTCVFYRKEEW